MTPSQFLRGRTDDAERTIRRVIDVSDGDDVRHLRAFARLYHAGLLTVLGREDDARALLGAITEIWDHPDDVSRLTLGMYEAATAGFLRSAGDDGGLKWRALLAGAYRLAGREPTMSATRT